MCGIIGVALAREGSPAIEPRKVVRSLTLLRHRGPDDSGYVFYYPDTREVVPAFDEETHEGSRSYWKLSVGADSVPPGWSAALGNRRLAILDLSPRGHQPMPNEEGSVWVVFNGEIYNFVELGKELEQAGHVLSCNCDTEVLVHGYEEWGIEGLLERLEGMWAFIILDARQGRMYVSRDAFGIKPLYYTESNGTIAFASEIKALAPFLRLEPEPRVLQRYLWGHRIGEEETLYKGIKRFPLAGLMELRLNNGVWNITHLDRYWTPPKKVSRRGYEEVVEEWKQAFLDSVKIHFRSDVPVGILLSGGIDSSSITMAWRRLRNDNLLERWASSGTPLAITFRHGGSRDEFKHAESVARETGVELIPIGPLTGRDIAGDIEEIIYYYDEPPQGPSHLAEWFVMKAFKGKAKVVISGQGGDELLAGYQKYVYAYLLHLLRMLRIHSFIIEAIRFRDLLLEKLDHLLYALVRKRGTGVAYSSYKVPQHCRSQDDPINDLLARDLCGDSLQRLLLYTDRNSMAFSIEARVPFLTRRLAELSLSTPGEYKLSKGWTKRLHRDAMKGILPDRIRLRRDKVGFEPPEHEWLVETLEQLGIDLEDSLKHLNNLLDAKYVEYTAKLVARFKKGKRLRPAEAKHLWRLLFAHLWVNIIEKGRVSQNNSGG